VSAWGLILVGAVTWLLVAVLLAVLLGRVVRRGDDQVPTIDQDGGAPRHVAVRSPRGKR
jgi:hypothetical protein